MANAGSGVCGRRDRSVRTRSRLEAELFGGEQDLRNGEILAGLAEVVCQLVGIGGDVVEARQHDEADQAGVQRSLRPDIRVLPGSVGRVIRRQTQGWLAHSKPDPVDLAEISVSAEILVGLHSNSGLLSK
jgi:hypothetical protein